MRLRRLRMPPDQDDYVPPRDPLLLTSNDAHDDGLPLPASTLPPDTLPPIHHHHKPPNPLLESATIVLWIAVVVISIYYLVTEQQRRRRRLRRQRQERLEVYSPKKQSNRRLELLNLLKSTTMKVQQGDLVYHGENDDNDILIEGANEALNCDLGQFSKHSSRGLSVKDVEEGNSGNHPQKAPENTLKDTICRENDDIRTIDDDSTSTTQEEEREDLHLCYHTAQPIDTSSSSWDESEDEDELWTLRLPSARQVPASCIICKIHYRVNDQITWSPNNSPQTNIYGCSHVFHQACIIEWLAKVPDCGCPVCRKPFCHLPRGVKK